MLELGLEWAAGSLVSLCICRYFCQPVRCGAFCCDVVMVSCAASYNLVKHCPSSCCRAIVIRRHTCLFSCWCSMLLCHVARPYYCYVLLYRAIVVWCCATLMYFLGHPACCILVRCSLFSSACLLRRLSLWLYDDTGCFSCSRASIAFIMPSVKVSSDCPFLESRTYMTHGTFPWI